MSKKISAIILAGGQGRRFNYQDKGLIMWHGAPLIAHVIEQIKPQVDQIIINCNRNINDYQGLGYALCQDKLPDYQGPLAGIQSALTLTKHPFILICPCDTPRLPQNLVTTLLTTLVNNDADVTYPTTGTRAHYLPALMRSSLSLSLQNHLKNKDKSMKGWYCKLKAVSADFSTAESHFFNINTPDLL